MKIEYQTSVDNGFDIDLITNLDLYKRKPEWFNTMTTYQHMCKTAKEFIGKHWDILFKKDTSTVKTARACPGLNNFFTQSIPLKFPCQVFIETTKRGEYRWTASEHFIKVSIHDPAQAPKLAEKYLILKFELPLYYRVTEDVQISFVDPVLYNEMNYIVSPGIIKMKKGDIQSLNIITFFPLEDAKYVFNPGEVLASMQFSSIIKGIEKKDLGDALKRHRPKGIENSRII